MNPLARIALSSALCVGTARLAAAEPAAATPGAGATLAVQVDKPGAKVSPMLWGIFFEDINFSADGGIYAELVRNRSLEDTDKPDPWSVLSSGLADVSLAVDDSRPASPKNPHSLKVIIRDAGTGRVGIANEGYFGMAFRQGEAYRLTLLARAEAGFAGPLAVTLESRDGLAYATGTLPKLTSEWAPYDLELTASGTDPHGRLVLATKATGVFWLDMVSLFPKTTWKNRPNGLRPDLAKTLVDLKPAFVRFPGGCWVEGDTMKLAYRWKQTIGDLAERRTQFNIWNYHATHGLGFHEYLQMCEDLGAEPLFVINCGMSHRENVPMEQMGEFVQDALDAIEYCNGPADSTWGALRAKAGHPAPFNLTYMEIGNENGGPAYQERYALFHDAIKAKYPQITLVANVPTDRRPPEIVDEHYYSTPEFFIQQAERYDKYDRKGPRIYVGEYAVTQGCGQGNLRGAIGEAAFMLGLERNSDIVAMASYAPLFVNVHHRAWNPDLINFDSYRVYGLPSYYVQQLFSEHRGDVVLPVTVRAPMVSDGPTGGGIGVGTWLTQAEFRDIRVTRGDQTLFAADFAKGTEGWKLVNGDWKTAAGALVQSAPTENVRALAGDRSWSDYTYSLKARKTGGAEGFLILFRTQDDNAKSWWNLGGWGNKRHAIEMGGIIGNEVPGQIETGRWYDIRIELKGASIKCYLDGKLLHDVTYPTVQALAASATRVTATGEVILKVVNVSRQEQPAEVALNGVATLGAGTATVLTSAKPEDENSLDAPTRVAPVTRPLPAGGPSLRHTFPPNSLTVLRLPVGK